MEDEAGQEISAGRRHIIERPRLTRLLDETSARVIMLVAPAGYGKTTLARQWLANRPHAWYQATAESADLAALGIGIAEVGTGLFQEVGSRLREALIAHHDVNVEMAGDFLASDLEGWPEGAWFAIDDYQWLSGEAEQVVDRLNRIPSMRMLVTSRRRPAWATPRKLLYGEVYEVGQNALAMSTDEANEVLKGMEADAARGLLALANGWPAVIGLASFADPSSLLDAESLPPELHAYIADELYASVKPSAQQTLCALSLLPAPTPDLALSLLNAGAEEALGEGVRVGFLTEEMPGTYYIHPLLRAFLRRKLKELSSESREAFVTRAVGLLLSKQLWEAALEVITEFQLLRDFDTLLESALYPLLASGRSSTMKKLVDFGQRLGISSPVMDLASAELAFLQGFHEQARELAEEAGSRLQDGPLATKAYCRAGQSAYFSDDPDGAIEHFRRARAIGGEEADTRTAIWGHFLASVEREDQSAYRLLDEFAKSGITSLDDRVRTQTGRLHLATRFGSLWQTLESAEHIGRLVSGAGDPTVRAAFWHAYSGGLRVAARYREALKATDRALEEVDTFQLEFARTHINLARAGIYLGTRRYDDSFRLLDQIEAIARSLGDIYLQLNECTLRCRAHLLVGDPRAAVNVTQREWPYIPSTGQYGEFLACSALARHRVGGAATDSLSRLEAAESASHENEASHLCLWVRALILCEADPERGKETLHAALEEAWKTGVLDPFVFAYRLEPTLFEALRAESTHSRREFLERLDETGEISASDHRLLEDLTPREREVLDLLAASKSNREIADQLYLSEATVKVHVRHILRKLGVRTRTEAAVQRVTMRWLEESGAKPQASGHPEAEHQ
jgi:ATP/maltotriose-dependent transcriptional regulator MalT